MHDFTLNKDILKYASVDVSFDGSRWRTDYHGNIWRHIDIEGSRASTLSDHKRALETMGLTVCLWQKSDIRYKLAPMEGSKALVDPNTGRQVSLDLLRTTVGLYGDSFGYLVVGDRVYPATGYICANIYEPRKGFWRAADVNRGNFLSRRSEYNKDAPPAVPDKHGLVATEFKPAPKWAVPGPVDRKESKRLREALQPSLDFAEVRRQLAGEDYSDPMPKHRAAPKLAQSLSLPETTTRNTARLARWIADNQPDLSPEQMLEVAVLAEDAVRLRLPSKPLEMGSATKNAIRESCRASTTADYLEIRDV